MRDKKLRLFFSSRTPKIASQLIRFHLIASVITGIGYNYLLLVKVAASFITRKIQSTY